MIYNIHCTYISVHEQTVENVITPCDIVKSDSNQQNIGKAVEQMTDNDEVASEPSDNDNSPDNDSNDEESQVTEHNNHDVGHSYITQQDSNGKSCNTEATEVVVNANDSKTSVELEVN